MDTTELLYRDETYAIRGAVYEVSREMGTGFLEAVYQECLAREFSRLGIGYIEHPELSLVYKGERLKTIYKPDFICYRKIVVELKVAEAITDEARSQVLNYLKATNLQLGLLINFGEFPKARIERFVHQP